MEHTIKGFNGIRGLAATIVVITHLHFIRSWVELGYISQGFADAIDGLAAVQIFFVLSGFLITYLLIQEQQKHGGISLQNFYIRRSLRIFPLYFFVVFLVAVAHTFGEHVSRWGSILFAAVYAHNFVPEAYYSSILGHTWSLAVEEHFYIIWPFIFVITAFRVNRLLTSVVIMLGTSLAAGYLLPQSAWMTDNFRPSGFSFVAGGNIAYGCLLALLLFKHSGASFMRSLLTQKGNLLLALLLWFNTTWLTTEDNVLTGNLRAIGFTLLIAWIYLNQQSLVTRALEWRPLRYLGTVSYGIYMYQGFFLSTHPIRSANQSWPPEPNMGLALLLICVPLSYHFLEKPITNLKHRFHTDRPRQASFVDIRVLAQGLRRYFLEQIHKRKSNVSQPLPSNGASESSMQK